jgi:hypothetical protein
MEIGGTVSIPIRHKGLLIKIDLSPSHENKLRGKEGERER